MDKERGGIMREFRSGSSRVLLTTDLLVRVDFSCSLKQSECLLVGLTILKRGLVVAFGHKRFNPKCVKSATVLNDLAVTPFGRLTSVLHNGFLSIEICYIFSDDIYNRGGVILFLACLVLTLDLSS